MSELITVLSIVGPALTTGLFGVIMWKLNKKEEAAKVVAKLSQETIEKVESHERAVRELLESVQELKTSTDLHKGMLQDTSRYMLQRYHAKYMIQGHIHSHQKREFLELFEHYSDAGGNGTAKGWAEEVCELPVRDDLPLTNPFMDMLKERLHE